MTAKRILVAGLFHETNTFVDDPTGLKDFQQTIGEAVLKCRGDSSPMGGFLAQAEEYGWEVLPVVDFRATPSGMVEDEVLEVFWQHFLEEWKRYEGGRVDAVYLVLHGAMVARGYEDLEGELLRRVRALPGLEKCLLFIVLDLHANVTQAMVQRVNGLTVYRENPHIDAREAAVRGARLLQRCFEENLEPKVFLARPEILWPAPGTGTADEPMKSLELAGRKIEETHAEVLELGVFAGFAHADIHDSGVAFTLMTTGEKAAADTILNEFIKEAEATREKGLPDEVPLEQVLERLKGLPKPVVLVEPSDNIGGGAPGDGTSLLRFLLENQIANSAIAIDDAAAVAALKKIQPGESLEISLGGKGSKLDPGPVPLTVTLVSLSDGNFELEDKQSHMASMCGDFIQMGDSAVVTSGGVTILITSLKTAPMDLGQWRSQGVDPAGFDVIIVKAAVAHRRAYDKITGSTFWVDTPGPCTSNLRRLPYKNVRRPVFPLD